MEIQIPTEGVVAWIKKRAEKIAAALSLPRGGDVWLCKLGAPSNYSGDSTNWSDTVRPYLVIQVSRKTAILATPEDPKRLVYKERKYVKFLTKVG